MQRTWNQAGLVAVAVLCSLAVTARVEAGHRHGGSCGSSGGYSRGYAYSGGYGSGYAYTDGSQYGDQAAYSGGWTKVTQPMYRRGLFGRRIFAGNQVVSVPATAEGAPQTAARTETEMDRSARAPGARTQREIDRTGRDAELRGGNRLEGPSTPSEPGIDGIAPRSTPSTPPTNRDENVVPPPPGNTETTPPSSGNEGEISPRQNTPLIP